MDGMTATMTAFRPVWDWLSPVVGTALAVLAQGWMDRRRTRRIGNLN